LAESPIRVMRVIARLNMGGPALHVSYLTDGLTSRGYATTLLAGQLARGEDSMAFVARDLAIPVHNVPQLHREISPLYDPIAIRRIAREIRRVRPQILHTHTAKAGAIGRAAALLVGGARPPIIVHTFHGHVLRGYFDPVRTELFRRTERALARQTSRLIAVSPEVRDDLVALGVAPVEKFSVIRLGIDLPARVANDDERAALRRLFGVPETTFVVGWIGRMTGIKRVDDTLLAFARLRDSGVDARLCLVGDGPDRPALESRLTELGIARETLLPGYQREIGPYLAFFDTLLLTSANEGTPVVAIEALAAGRPVVATAVGGVPDVVTHEQDGLLTEVGDIDALGAALVRLAGDPALRRQMGESGRTKTLPRYAVSRLVDDIDGLYRELLSDSGLALPQPSA
jgi:glycosyltransferase involved in cell wall biosynthesis